MSNALHSPDLAPWTQSAPDAWRRTYLGHLVDVRSGATPSKDEPSFWGGEVPWVSPKDMKVLRISDSEDHITGAALSCSGLRWIPAGSVLMVTRGMILDHTVPIALAGRPLTINQDMKALLPRGDLRGDFLAWLLVGLNPAILARVEEAAHGTKALRTEQWKRLALAIPPAPLQRQVVEYLDRKTACIDALTAKQESLLVRLTEKRQALITQAVTKGLAPNTPRKDSGEPWLGEVPAHWSTVALRHHLKRIEQGWSPACENREAEDEAWGVLKVGCVNYGRFRDTESKALPPDMPPLPEYEVRVGDVLMSRANTRELVGSAAFVDRTRPRLLLCDKLFRLHHCRANVDPRFLALLLQSTTCRAQLERAATGASGSMQNIGQDSVRRLLFAWPPIVEQRSIVAHLDQELRRLDELAQRVEALVDKVREYRQALITAAVTGKIDVTTEHALAAPSDQLEAQSA